MGMLSAMAASGAVDGVLQEAERGSMAATRARRRGKRGFITAGLIAFATCILLLLMGRPAICTCGTIELWHGAIDSGNSQHLSDWYSFSHVIHGFLFYACATVLFRRQPIGVRLAAAVAVECFWEILENSPLIIDRYRTATIALGYSGDSVLNSMSDIGMMVVGFLFASRAPVWITAVVAVGFELLALAVIRDNLTLNVLMLTVPIEALKNWQAAL